MVSSRELTVSIKRALDVLATSGALFDSLGKAHKHWRFRQKRNGC